jgi:O-antigen/teichoic acid export membrane protein
MIKTLAPYSLEIGAKLIGLITSIVVVSLLTVADFGEYSFLRSFALLSGTILIFGLQASSFKFANKSYPLANEYLAFSVIIMAGSVLTFWVFNAVFGDLIFGRFKHDLRFYAYFLVFSSLVLLFVTAYMKARGRAIVGFTINFIVVLLFLVILLIFQDRMDEVEEVLTGLVLIHLCLAITVLGLMLLHFYKTKINFSRIKSHQAEWTEVSFSMWLGGFLPAALLQGLTIVFGIYFTGVTLGEMGMALIIVINLGVFKEVSIALFLPKLIGYFNKTERINYRTLIVSISIGVIPILGFLVVLYPFEAWLISTFPTKLSSTVFNFIYVLSIAQILMAIYQPIFRLLSATGRHKSVLYCSVTLMLVLVFSYYVSAEILNNYLYVVFCPVVICGLAVCCSLVLVKVKRIDT